VGYDKMRLALVNVRAEASSDAEAGTVGLEIIQKAATASGLSLQPEVRRVVAATKRA